MHELSFSSFNTSVFFDGLFKLFHVILADFIFHPFPGGFTCFVFYPLISSCFNSLLFVNSLSVSSESVSALVCVSLVCVSLVCVSLVCVSFPFVIALWVMVSVRPSIPNTLGDGVREALHSQYFG